MALEEKISNENNININEEFQKSLDKRHAIIGGLGTIIIPLTYYSGHLPDSFFSDGYATTLLTMGSAFSAYESIYHLIKNK